MDVLHDWADAEALAILTAIRRAATADARVFIIEGILPEHLDPGRLSLDVIMLALTGGRERTADELASLLSAAGLQLKRVIDTPAGSGQPRRTSRGRGRRPDRGRSGLPTAGACQARGGGTTRRALAQAAYGRLQQETAATTHAWSLSR